MTLFKHPFSHLSHESTPAVASSMSLDTWCHQSSTESTRFVQRVEMCTALCTGEDVLGMPLDTNHHHTLLRVSLVSTCGSPAALEDTLLIERVLSTCGAYHCVTPHAEPLSADGALFHPDVHDRICVITGGSSIPFTRDLIAERILTFGNRALSLATFAQILALVSRSTKLSCDSGDCKFQSREFAFTCLAALAPTLPPRLAGQEMASPVDSYGWETVDDSVFELSAEAFLVQIPWLVSRDPASMEALELIEVLKDQSRDRTLAWLYN